MAAHGFTFTTNPEAETNSSRIEKSLRQRRIGAREVADLREAQIPPFMQVRGLCQPPNPIDWGADIDLDVNAPHLACPQDQTANAISADSPEASFSTTMALRRSPDNCSLALSSS